METRAKQDLAALKAFNRYKNMFQKMRVHAINGAAQFDTLGEAVFTKYPHLHYTCDHCIYTITNEPENFPVDKYSRWLGFIQGVLIINGETSVTSERNITRPWFNYE